MQHKDNSTITHPVIDLAIVSGDPASLGYNYAYIAAYNRYYFVTEWTYALGIWTCRLSVDVLASYKTAIGALSKYVTRSASQYDLDVQDSMYPAKTGTTEFMVFLSAAMVVLSKYSRQEDIVIGTPISGRTHKDTEGMLGMFVNTLAMRGRPEGKKTYEEFLKEI